MVIPGLSADEEFLTLSEVARILRLSERTVYRFIDEGSLKRYKLPANVFIRKKDLLQFLNERRHCLTKKREEENR